MKFRFLVDFSFVSLWSKQLVPGSIVSCTQFLNQSKNISQESRIITAGTFSFALWSNSPILYNIKYPIVHIVLVPRVNCCNKVVLKRPCCVYLVVQVKSQNITFLATRIGRFSISLDSAWFLDNAVCVVAYKMTSTNTSGLFGRVSEFNVERETFSAYVERMEMFFTANNIVETT